MELQMENGIYRNLQKHLHKQAVGFPKVKSGADITLLKRIFTPLQAQIALNLSYRFESSATLFPKVQKILPSINSIETLDHELDQMVQQGGIIFRARNQIKYYALVPLVVGIYEMQLPRLTIDYAREIDAYMHDQMFELHLIGTEYSQMRTIPIEKSINPTHSIFTYNNVRQLIQNSPGPFVINKCICREKRKLYGSTCKATKRTELCLAIGDMAALSIHKNTGREITREEAMEIITQDENEGLVLQPSGEQDPQFICACCGCCCGMLNALKKLPRAAEFWTSYYVSSVDPSKCKACGLCAKKCPMEAIIMAETAQIKPLKCIGCGVCVSKCPNKAIKLEPKPFREIPKTTDDFYGEMVAHRKNMIQLIFMALKMKKGKKWH